ncbi:MAG: glucosylceramidase, partial [Muribaculaceae bacterium]|nr:glucosylceramidase [Muribaculaceae bacterium]
MSILSALAVAAIALTSCDNDVKIGPQPQPEPEKVAGTDVRVITTTASRSFDLAESTIGFSERDNMSPSSIYLRPSEEFQTMDGFGVAITGSTCYNLLRMKPEDRAEFLQATFSPSDGYGFSYCRISIGCSDFSLSEYTCCDTPGIENFALTSEETEYVIPVLKEILAINPDLKIMGTPWTPPRWMNFGSATLSTPYE